MFFTVPKFSMQEILFEFIKVINSFSYCHSKKTKVESNTRKITFIFLTDPNISPVENVQMISLIVVCVALQTPNVTTVSNSVVQGDFDAAGDGVHAIVTSL